MKILILCALMLLIHISEASTYIGKLHDNDYVNSCKATGSKVCMNCKTVGICTQPSSTFVVEVSETCSENKTCYPPTGEKASCEYINPAISPECKCNTANACEIDPSDNLSFVICTDPITYGTCDAGYEFDSVNCVCGGSGDCPACGAYSSSNTDCSSYVNCSTGSSILMRCPVNSCFNLTECKCNVECPPCGYLPDPDNSPSGYINCSDGSDTKVECVSQVFDSAQCICVSSTETPATTSSFTPTTTPTATPTTNPTTAPTTNPTITPTITPTTNPTINPTINPTTTPTTNPTIIPTTNPTTNPTITPTTTPTTNPTITPTRSPTTNPTLLPTIPPITTPTTVTTSTGTTTECPACGYKPDPDNIPSGFIYCQDGSNDKGQCPGQVFDAGSCRCVSCPACGYIPDPDNTSGYIRCQDGAKSECPGGQVFDGETCGCASTTTTAITTPSTETTTTSTTKECPACGYMPDPDNTPSGYIRCQDGAKSMCPGGQVFNGETCACDSSITTSTTISTTTTTTNADPCAYCGYYAYPGDTTKYYKCIGDMVYVYSCPAGFNFNPVSCYCE